QENPLDIIERMKFFEVQKNVVVSDHGAIIEVILFSPSFWKKLPENYRKIVRDAFREVAAEVERGTGAGAAKSLVFVREAARRVRVPAAAAQKQMRDAIYPAARDAYFAMAGDEGGRLLKLYAEQLALVSK